MDENKRAKLKVIGYTINLCCGLCEHGNFPDASAWGTCSFWPYNHRKHTETKRQLSINRFGGCEAFAPSARRVATLETFTEFLSLPQEPD